MIFDVATVQDTITYLGSILRTSNIFIAENKNSHKIHEYENDI